VTEQRPLTDADGRVVTVTTIESTEDDAGLPDSIYCHSERVAVTIHHGDDGEDGDDD
jgi:hypothetical protein